MISIRKELSDYIEAEILPLYDAFDKGHRQEHARNVIKQALELCCHYEVDPEMIFVAAAFHDTGLSTSRETHHLESGRIIRKDKCLPKWFSAGQIETIAQAAEDHRASLSHEPRTIYGRIIAEADRQIEPGTVLRRTIQFGMKTFPALDKESHWARTLEHLREKYAEGGYLKLWIPESPNASKLQELRELIVDEKRLRERFDEIFEEENK